MLLFNAAVFLALRLSVGHAQENAVDLSVLDGLSDTEIATKFASNPELLRKFLRAANVNVGGIRRSSSSRLSGSAQSSNQETPLPLGSSSEEVLHSTSCAAVKESLGSSPPGWDETLEYHWVTSSIHVPCLTFVFFFSLASDSLEYLGIVS